MKRTNENKAATFPTMMYPDRVKVVLYSYYIHNDSLFDGEIPHKPVGQDPSCGYLSS